MFINSNNLQVNPTDPPKGKAKETAQVIKSGVGTLLSGSATIIGAYKPVDHLVVDNQLKLGLTHNSIGLVNQNATVLNQQIGQLNEKVNTLTEKINKQTLQVNSLSAKSAKYQEIVQISKNIKGYQKILDGAGSRIEQQQARINWKKDFERYQQLTKGHKPGGQSANRIKELHQELYEAHNKHGHAKKQLEQLKTSQKTQLRQLNQLKGKYKGHQQQLTQYTSMAKTQQQDLTQAVKKQTNHHRLANGLALASAGFNGYMAVDQFNKGNAPSAAGHAAATVGNVMLAASSKLPGGLKKPAIALSIGGSFLGLIQATNTSNIQTVN